MFSLAYKKGILTESDIRVLENYSKKNQSDLLQEEDPAKGTGIPKNPHEPAEKS